MKRDILNSLLSWKVSSDRKPLIIRGARQVGKSWTVREFGKNFTSFAEINFDQNHGRMPWLRLKELGASRSTERLTFQVMVFYRDGTFVLHRTSPVPGKPLGLDLEKAALADLKTSDQMREVYLLVTNPGQLPADYEISTRA